MPSNYMYETADGRQIPTIEFQSANGDVEFAIVQSPNIVKVNTPDASDTAWTQAAHRLFTVTGMAFVRVWGLCTEDLVGAGTLEVGVAGSTASLIAQLANATTWDVGELLGNPTTATVLKSLDPGNYILVNDTDIDLTVGTANITNGKGTFYCQWIPVDANSVVAAAVWD